MARRSLDNPRVQGDRARRGKPGRQERQLRALKRRIEQLEAALLWPTGICTHGEDAQAQLNRAVSNIFTVRGEIPPFLRRRPLVDALAWLAEDVQVPRGVVLGGGIAIFGALLGIAARWWL
ncbi:hypothetical protein [uncultured Arenimonas sp.]|uniref:hypothetical protein n=1 Tax=uncultured Arenimonas sp. TaxID=546226 RepID=UPI0030DD32FA